MSRHIVPGPHKRGKACAYGGAGSILQCVLQGDRTYRRRIALFRRTKVGLSLKCEDRKSNLLQCPGFTDLRGDPGFDADTEIIAAVAQLALQEDYGPSE